MTVIKVFEDNHGLICLAKDYKSALDFLVNNNWIEDSSEVWNGPYASPEWCRLDEAMGEDWFDKMANWGIENFNEYWDGSFCLEETEIYGN